MADTVQFDLVSPERRLASLAAREVQIPAAEGDMTAMAGHAPTITTLRPGLLRVVHAGGAQEFVVSGGFAEITGTSVSVLAELALDRTEANPAAMGRMLADLQAGVDAARSKGDAVAQDEAQRLLGELTAVADRLGLPRA